jgi:hypothetical protein
MAALAQGARMSCCRNEGLNRKNKGPADPLSPEGKTMQTNPSKKLPRCKYCAGKIFFHTSKRTGKKYVVNAKVENGEVIAPRNDFHNCAAFSGVAKTTGKLISTTGLEVDDGDLPEGF